MAEAVKAVTMNNEAVLDKLEKLVSDKMAAVSGAKASTEVQYLMYTVLLYVALLPLLMLAGLTSNPGYVAGNRDGAVPPELTQGIRGRIRRTVDNTRDAIIFFGIVVLACHTQGISNEATILAARVMFVSRIVYSVVYIVGVPLVRTAVWTVGLASVIVLAVQAAHCTHMGTLGLEHVNEFIDVATNALGTHMKPYLDRIEL